MNHIAIMKKSWGLTQKILSCKKRIESRWYKNKRAPWGKICTGDTVYFKNSGEPITIKAEVSKVMTFEDLTPKVVKKILERHGCEDGIEKSKIPFFFELFKNKRYCLLIFLENPQKITPFEINKTGFGMMSAWLTVRNVDDIKI